MDDTTKLKQQHDILKRQKIAAFDSYKAAENALIVFESLNADYLSKERENEVKQYHEDKKTKQLLQKERAKLIRGNSQIGDWVIVKTRHGNQAKRVTKVEPDYGLQCEVPETIPYLYKNGKWVDSNSYQSKYWDRRTDLYSYNSVVGKIYTDDNGEVIFERYKL